MRKGKRESDKKQKMSKWMDKGGAKAKRGYSGPTWGLTYWSIDTDVITYVTEATCKQFAY